MVALKTERRVFMWNLAPRPVPLDAPVTVTLSEIQAIIQAAFDKKTAMIYLNEDGRLVPDDGEKDLKNCIYLAAIRNDPAKKITTYLINRGDPAAVDSAYITPSTLDVRNVKPQEEETQGWSAHLVISTAERPGNKYRACFERIPNTYSGLVGLLFRTLLDRFTASDPKYSYTKPVKKGKKVQNETKSYKLRLDVQKVPSEQIIKDLEKGELSNISLIRKSSTYSGPGAPDVVKEVTSKLQIKTKKVDQKKIADFVDELMPWAKKQDFQQIQFNMRKLPGNTSASPRFTLEKEDAMEALYVRSQRITGFNSLLESCYKNVCDEIEEKMIALINDNDKW